MRIDSLGTKFIASILFVGQSLMSCSGLVNKGKEEKIDQLARQEITKHFNDLQALNQLLLTAPNNNSGSVANRIFRAISQNFLAL